ncbi:unnamed protein product [Chilo suppressalis]|uniref:Uncharacterized protein n=1 Tax=Chilo suppressalis TaxID=168631 RepID=A0ABN8BCQ4_CHISP|nr:unnamed protein product [Chilo suppressalis]
MSDHYKDLIKMMEEAYVLLSSLSGPCKDEAVNKWLEIGDRNIASLNRQLRGSLSVGEKMKIQSTILILKTLCEKIIYEQNYVQGGDLQHDVERPSPSVVWREEENVFELRISTGSIVNLKHVNLRDFLNDAKVILCEKFKQIIDNNGSIKVNFSLACKFNNVKDGEFIEEIKYFTTPNELFMPSSDIEGIIVKKVIDVLLAKVEDFEERDSGWSMVEIVHLQVNINRYDPLAAGASTFIPLPKFIQDRKQY